MVVESLSHILIPGLGLIAALSLPSGKTLDKSPSLPETGPRVFKEVLIIILTSYGISVRIP